MVKSLASALCIGSGGSVGREGPIVQIGSALASSVGQWVRMPENRLRIMVACGAAGGISATFNAPITGVFFGVEIILREFAVDALFTVMLSAMIADVVAIPFLGDKPFLSGFPAGITLQHPRNYLLVAVLAVIAALMGLAFKNVLYKVEDWCDALWKGRPEWARPAVLGLAFGLLLLALPQMYGVGYPVMFKTTAGDYAIWFLIVLAFGKILATSLSIGHRRLRRHLRPVAVHRRHHGHGLRRHRRPPVRRRRRAARAVRGGRDGRGVHLRRPRPADLAGQRRGDDRRLLPHPAGHARGRDRLHRLPGAELRHDLHHQAAAPRHRHRPRRPVARRAGPEDHRRHAALPGRASRTAATAPWRVGPAGNGSAPGPEALPGPVTYRHDAQALFASESLGQALRQLEVYGRDGLPVLSADGHRVQGWVTSAGVLRALAREVSGAHREAAQAQAAAGGDDGDAEAMLKHPPVPLPGYQVIEITISDGSPAAGRKLDDVRWPPAAPPSRCCAAGGSTRPDPGSDLRPGDRVSLLIPEPQDPPPPQPGSESREHPASNEASST